VLIDWRTGTQASALVNFHISLTEFDGPFDLLLHLVEKQGFDLTTISLVSVTAQYLAYIDNLDVAYTDATSEFLVVGSQLVLLKSRALLPANAAEDDEADDGSQLAARLKVYSAFRQVAGELEQLQDEEATLFHRTKPALTKPEVHPETGSADELVQAIRNIVNQAANVSPQRQVPTSRFNLGERVLEVSRRILAIEIIEFSDLTRECQSRLEIIYTLLAVLHLVGQRKITVHQKESFGTIQIKNTEPI
jgi:segregation and condensation protein A